MGRQSRRPGKQWIGGRLRSCLTFVLSLVSLLARHFAQAGNATWNLSPDPDAAFTGAATSPLGLAASEDGRFLYVLKSATGEIAAYQISGTSLDAAVYSRAIAAEHSRNHGAVSER